MNERDVSVLVGHPGQATHKPALNSPDAVIGMDEIYPPGFSHFKPF
jgi:hypothetical protein